MATSMAFYVDNAGLISLNFGSVLLGLNRDGEFQRYSWLGNTSTSGISTCASVRSFYIPADNLADDLDGKIARVKIEGGVLAYGTTEFIFEVYDEDQSDAVYSVTRRPKVTGRIVDKIDLLASLTRLHNSFFERTISSRKLARRVIEKQLGFHSPDF
jgi:hypothetical protein